MPRPPKKPRPELPPRGACVLIRWVDIQTDTGWADVATAAGLAVCHTVGFVTHANVHHISVAASYSKEGDAHETNLRQSIPTSCIQSWKRLDAPDMPL